MGIWKLLVDSLKRDEVKSLVLILLNLTSTPASPESVEMLCCVAKGTL